MEECINIDTDIDKKFDDLMKIQTDVEIDPNSNFTLVDLKSGDTSALQELEPKAQVNVLQQSNSMKVPNQRNESISESSEWKTSTNN